LFFAVVFLYFFHILIVLLRKNGFSSRVEIIGRAAFLQSQDSRKAEKASGFAQLRVGVFA